MGQKVTVEMVEMEIMVATEEVVLLGTMVAARALADPEV
jgi:hypothetical protein